MKIIGEISLPLARALSKLLIILPFCILSADKFVYVGYIAILFFVEVFLLLKFRSLNFWIILFSSFFSYIIIFSIKELIVFVAFFICDFVSILTIFIRSLILIIPLVGFVSFSFIFPPLVYTSEVLSKNVKPYYEDEKKIDYINLGSFLEDIKSVSFRDGQFFAKIVHGSDVFLLRVQAIDDREIVIVSIIFILTAFFISFYISRYVIEVRSKNITQEQASREHQREEVILRESDGAFHAYVEYLRDSLIRIKENFKNEKEDIDFYEKDVAKFESLAKRVVEQAHRSKAEIISFLKDYIDKIKLKENYSYMIDKISEIVGLLEEVRTFSNNLLSDILILKEDFIRYERNINRGFREFENFFHEIFSPLGGIENQLNSLKISFSEKSSYHEEIFSRCEQMISEIQIFLSNLSEIYESFHILHLNSQVRAHKIRDKIPSFEVIPHAIYMMLGKMRELISNIQAELNLFQGFIQELKKSYSQFSFSMNFEDVSQIVSDMKSTLEGIVSHVSSIKSTILSNVKSALSTLSEFENSISSFSNVVSDILYDISETFPQFGYAISQIQTENEKLIKSIKGCVGDYELKQK